MDDRIYAVWLSLAVAEKKALPVLFSRFASPREIYEASDYDFLSAISVRTASRLADKSLDMAGDILQKLDKCGAGVLSYEHPYFPQKLRVISSPPCVLFYKGKLKNLNKECSVAVVGTRSISSYGAEMTYKFAYSFAACGACVVSGLAAGADGEAHRGALDAGGYSVAFLGTPIDRVYPLENAALFERMEKHGLILSEYYPGCVTNAKSFPIRNRLISGISSATLVTEAGVKSGSLITARDAVMQGKPAFAIPGQVGSEGSMGTNAMLQRGAHLASGPSDVLEALELMFPDIISQSDLPNRIIYNKNRVSDNGYGKLKQNAPKPETKTLKKEKPQKAAEALLPDGLNASEKAICEALALHGSRNADELARQTGLEISEVLSTLTVLEIFGHIIPESGGRYILK